MTGIQPVGTSGFRPRARISNPKSPSSSGRLRLGGAISRHESPDWIGHPLTWQESPVRACRLLSSKESEPPFSNASADFSSRFDNALSRPSAALSAMTSSPRLYRPAQLRSPLLESVPETSRPRVSHPTMDCGPVHGSILGGCHDGLARQQRRHGPLLPVRETVVAFCGKVSLPGPTSWLSL